jgi:hypothetical protein
MALCLKNRPPRPGPVRQRPPRRVKSTRAEPPPHRSAAAAGHCAPAVVSTPQHQPRRPAGRLGRWQRVGPAARPGSAAPPPPSSSDIAEFLAPRRGERRHAIAFFRRARRPTAIAASTFIAIVSSSATISPSGQSCEDAAELARESRVASRHRPAATALRSPSPHSTIRSRHLTSASSRAPLSSSHGPLPTVYPSRAGESPSCAARRRRPVVLVDVPPPERLLPLPASPAQDGAAALLRGPRRGSGAPWPHRRLGCLAQFCRHCRDAVAKLFAPRQAAAASYGSCASACRLRHRAPEPSASRCPLSSRRHSWPPLAPRQTPWALRIAELTSCAWPAQSGRLGRAAQRAGPVRSTQDSLSALPAQPKAAISPAGRRRVSAHLFCSR